MTFLRDKTKGFLKKIIDFLQCLKPSPFINWCAIVFQTCDIIELWMPVKWILLIKNKIFLPSIEWINVMPLCSILSRTIKNKGKDCEFRIYSES